MSKGAQFRAMTMEKERSYPRLRRGLDMSCHDDGCEHANVADDEQDDADAISMSYSISDGYSQHLAVVLTSVLVNNPGERFEFHILSSDLSTANREKLGMLERVHSSCSIVFHQINASLFEKLPIPPALEHVTREMYYRYLLPEVLEDENRTVYSDVDVLCVGKMRPLWEIDLQGNIIAAVPDEEAELKWRELGLPTGGYFCSGLLVMDLAAMRAGGFTRRLFDTTEEFAPKLSWPDQDVINIVFRDRILALPGIWNCVSPYNPFRRDVRQWHFQGFTQKPWCNIWRNMTWPVYLKYLLMSPYRANAICFVWGHVKGFFYFKYTKKRVTRYILCGIRVWKRKEDA